MGKKSERSKAYAEAVTAIQKAVAELNGVENPNVLKYCRDRQLPYQRVRRALSGGHNRSTRPQAHNLLTQEQDSALLRYCIAVDDIGFGVT